MFNKEKALQDLKNNSSKTRYEHSLAVGKKAKELAEIHCEDTEKAYLAGIFHDFAKYMKQEEANKILIEMGVTDEFLLNDSRLAHGQIGAYILEKDYGLKDKEILSAISKHTFGDVNMTKLDMIVYIADAIEPNRDYPSVEKLRKLADNNLEEACFEYLKHNFKYLLQEDRKIYTKSVEMYNLMLERGKNGF